MSHQICSVHRPIFLVGPTASGKTAMAVALAERLNGEILSADSMQIYQGMKIGTAAPSESEQKGIPHHLIGVIPPSESFSVERYRSAALPIIRDILSRGKTAIVAGGTGLYFDALLLSDSYAPVEPDLAYRAELNELAEEQGVDAVHRLLAACDPEAAARLHPNNLKRVIRALEVYRLTGASILEHDRLSHREPPEFQPIWLGIAPASREDLYARIDQRVDRMIEQGLVDELRTLLTDGLSAQSTAMQAIGYKELIPVVSCHCSLEAAVDEIKKRSRNYAKRQLTWFRRNPSIHWLLYQTSDRFSDLIDDAMQFLCSQLQSTKMP